MPRVLAVLVFGVCACSLVVTRAPHKRDCGGAATLLDGVVGAPLLVAGIAGIISGCDDPDDPGCRTLEGFATTTSAGVAIVGAAVTGIAMYGVSEWKSCRAIVAAGDAALPAADIVREGERRELDRLPCIEQRRAMLRAAQSITDAGERGRYLATLPRCDSTE